MRTLKFIVERHSGGFLAYPLGLRGVVIGQGESSEEALEDAKSAAKFHIETFGSEAFDDESDVQAAYVVEGDVADAGATLQ
jgi:predicted RNase H-like HicB family nuclease